MFCRDIKKKTFRFFHEWDKWELATERIHVAWGYNREYDVTVQVRECEYCGKTQKRKIS